MLNFNQRATQLLDKNKYDRRLRYFALIMSVIVVVSVCTSLIMPAVSLTKLAASAGSGSYGNAFDFGDNITSVTAESTGNNGNTASVSFNLSYEKISTNVVSKDNPYIKYQLDTKHIKIPEGGMPANKNNETQEIDGLIWGPVYDGEQSGWYHIFDDGTIVIRFFDEYLESAAATGSGEIKGDVKFNADVERDEDEIGDKAEFAIGNKQITIDGYTPKELGMSKSNTKNGDTVTWKIEIENPAAEDLGGSTLTDAMFKDAVPGSITINGSAAAADDSVFTFPANSTEKKYTITYETKLDADAVTNPDNYNDWGDHKENNTAVLKKDDKEIEKTSELSYKMGFSLNKNGSADFENNQINWNITINNDNKVSLNGLKIQDDMLKDATSITYPAGMSGEIDKETGTLTLTGEFTGNYDWDQKPVITYSTPAEEGTTYNNKAQLTNKEDKPMGDPVEKEVSFVTTTISKNGWQDEEDIQHRNKWRITINNGSGNIDWKDYFVSDEMLKYAEDLKITVRNGWHREIKDGFTLDTETGKITFGDISIDQISEFDEIVIEYYTPAFDTDMEGVTQNGDKYVSVNKAQFGIGDNTVGETDEKTVEAQKRSSITKTCDTNSAVEDKENATVVIPWTLDIEREPGDFIGVSINDSIYDHTGTVNKVVHEITEEQIASIRVEYTEDNTSHTIDSSYYKVTKTDSGFDLEFISGADETFYDKFYNVKIYYSTTVHTDDLDTDVEYKFKNKAKLGDKETDSEFPYTKREEGFTPYAKYDADQPIDNQIPNGTVRKSQDKLEKVNRTIDGTEGEYYKFDYRIILSTEIISSGFILIDTLPDNFILDPENKPVGTDHDPYNDYPVTFDDCDELGYTPPYNSYYQLIDGGKKLKFGIQGNLGFGYSGKRLYIDYSLLIKAETLDNILANDPNYRFVNSIQDESQIYPPSDQTQSFEKSTLNKEASRRGLMAGLIDYTIDVNPNGANLSIQDMITLEDTLTVGSVNVSDVKNELTNSNVSDDQINTSVKDPGDLRVSLQSIRVNLINPDGTLGRPLTPTEFSYVLDNNPQFITNSQELTGVHDNNGEGKYFDADNAVLVPGSEFEVTVKGATNLRNKECGWDLKINAGWDQDIINSHSTHNIRFDENGDATLKITLPETLPATRGTVKFNLWDSLGSCESISLKQTTQTRDYAAKLTLNLPDEMPLRVTYRYLTARDNDSDYDFVNAMNSISIDTMFVSESSEANQILKVKDKDQASSSTDGGIRLIKVDVGDYSIKLDAGFQLHRWNASQSCWETATEIGYVTQEGGQATNIHQVTEWTKSDEVSGEVGGENYPVTIRTDKNDDYQISLQTGTIYKIVEVEAPNPYFQLAEPRYFVYGNAPSSSVISDATASDPNAANYTLVPTNGQMQIQNYKDIEVSTTKTWSDSSDHSNDSATVQLYRSHTRQTAGIPKDAVAVEGAVKLDNDNEWKTSWANLPSGTDDGRPWYYYVKEESYTIGGKTFIVGESEDGEYVPYYYGNGTNVDAEITLQNSNKLTIAKIWRDSEGDEMLNPPLDEIRFELYRSTVSPTSQHEADENGVPVGAVKVTYGDTDGNLQTPDRTDFVLTKNDSWSIGLSLPAHDDEGNTYYYYAVELTTLDKYAVSITDGITSTGTVTITNKSTEKSEGIELPGTGGIGTKLFYVFGGTLAVGALAFIHIKHRRKTA